MGNGPKIRGGLASIPDGLRNGDSGFSLCRDTESVTGVRRFMNSGVFGVFESDQSLRNDLGHLIKLIPEVSEDTSSFVDELVQIYDEICRVPEQDSRMMALHDLFMDSLYSRRFLPLLQQIERGGQFDTEDEDGAFQGAIMTIAGILEEVRERAGLDNVSSYEAFLEMYDDAVRGHNMLISHMVGARNAALACIGEARNVIDDQEFVDEAGLVIDEVLELETGLNLPPEFGVKLKDPNTKVVVISLDFNSTFNLDESYAHPDLSANAQRAYARFALEFRRAFPEKELVIAINTGRPGMYAWGVAESGFMPMDEFRKIAVGEAGGVVLREGLNEGVMDVAVEHPFEWRNELDSLREYLLKMINNSQSVVIEPKLSMLSIRVSRDGKYLHRANGSEYVDEKWMESQVRRYLKSAYSRALDDYHRVLWSVDEVVSRHAGVVAAAMQKVERFEDAISQIRPLFHLLTEEQNAELERIEARIKTLEAMYHERQLVTNYNSTAGYVDIGHRDLNKFSTLAGHICKERGVGRNNLLYLQIGDSSIDRIPCDRTGVGEPNEGADDAFLVAVANCNGKLNDAATARGSRGMVLKNRSVLGAISLAEGLRKMVRKIRFER